MPEIGEGAREAAAALERIAEEARSGTPAPEVAEQVRVKVQGPHPAPETARSADTVARPCGAEVNSLWRTALRAPGGVRGRLLAFVSRLFGFELGAQERFNGAQVRFDNSLLEWIDARFASTHRHYDSVLGQVGRHLGEVDTRHLMLQDELVKHTHDLVSRIDLVLSEAEQSRMGLSQALKRVRDRLEALEKRPGPE